MACGQRLGIQNDSIGQSDYFLHLFVCSMMVYWCLPRRRSDGAIFVNSLTWNTYWINAGAMITSMYSWFELICLLEQWLRLVPKALSAPLAKTFRAVISLWQFTCILLREAAFWWTSSCLKRDIQMLAKCLAKNIQHFWAQHVRCVEYCFWCCCFNS